VPAQRRNKGGRKRPQVSSLINLLLSGVHVTIHDTTSGEYRNANFPTGWSHATIRQEGNAFYMLGQNGSRDWKFATLKGSKITATPTPDVFWGIERQTAAIVGLSYMFGLRKTLPRELEIKAPAACSLCGRKLTAGRSLTLFNHPKYGLGFFGPHCAKRDTPEADKRAQGFERMNALLRAAPTVPSHVSNCPCHKCKKD
jgi:hypothetical protein